MKFPENKSEARLNDALKVLAAGTQSGPPEALGEALSTAFRRHHARRRSLRRTAMVAALVAASLPSLWILKRNDSRRTNASKAVDASRIESPNALPFRDSRPLSAITHAATEHAVKRTRTSSFARPVEFIALPGYSVSARTEDARIVRLQLSGRALRMVGAPVSAENDNRRLLADFVVGQDGTPYAVRLVH